MNDIKVNTSAEQLHQSSMNLVPVRGKDKRFFVDLDICATGKCKIKDCVAQCSYFYHPDNYGVIGVAELATYALVCRRCEAPHCVPSCPVEALEQQKEKNKLLIRHNMRCVSCKSCSHACPYGTIYPELLPLFIHNCDFCLDRRGGKEEPLCVTSCPFGALSLKSADEPLEENAFLVGDHIVIRSTHWTLEKA
jgi:Fe-S-cluster-containing dehydrogenase component